MTRLIIITIAVLAGIWLLLALEVLPEPVANVFRPIVATASSLAIPALFITAYAAPGLLHNFVADVQHFWRRFQTRGRDVDDLQRKIVHLDRAYHMHQLGLIYLNQGRYSKAKPLFEQALAKDPDSLDTKYRLGVCLFAQKQYAAAAELLEQVNAKTPEHDYGMAYLRLAESHQFCGNLPRAAEVYRGLLRYSPGHPEGCYHYALLLAEQGSLADAHKLMNELIFTVRHSPGFHRRRNRHWALKARWWLMRHRSDAGAISA